MARFNSVADLIRHHEGYRHKLYIDTTGHATIGIGRNLTEKGLSASEIDQLFANDLRDALMDARTFPWYNQLNAPRRAVVLDMLFNLGKAEFLQFTRMISALEAADYGTAADEMLDSKWAKQVGNQPGQRAHRLSEMMRSGTWATS